MSKTIKGRIEKPPTDMRHVDIMTDALPSLSLRDRVLKVEGEGKTQFFRVWFSRRLKSGLTRLYLSAPLCD